MAADFQVLVLYSFLSSIIEIAVSFVIQNLTSAHCLNSKYDLYSKSKVRVDVEKVKPYYMSLIEKVITDYETLNY